MALFFLASYALGQVRNPIVRQLNQLVKACALSEDCVSRRSRSHRIIIK
jgi:hypothetical protein